MSSITDRDGHLIEQYGYDAFGKVFDGKFEIDPDNPKKANIYGFAGQRYEPELGVYSFTFRDYNPRTMRWMTMDPLKDGENFYNYCDNDPVNFNDPLGLLVQAPYNNAYSGPDPSAPLIDTSLPSEKLIKEVLKVIGQADTQPGYPAANGNTKTTWCNRAAIRIANDLGYNTDPLLNKNSSGKPDLDVTNANSIAKNAAKAAQNGEIREVTPEQAQELANQGIVVIAVQDNSSIKINGNEVPGHVGIVVPSTEPYDPTKGPLIGQAGRKNRIDEASDSFLKPKSESQIVHYYELKHK